MTISSSETLRSSAGSDAFQTIRRHPGRSLISFICCAPFVAFAVGA